MRLSIFILIINLLFINIKGNLFEKVVGLKIQLSILFKSKFSGLFVIYSLLEKFLMVVKIILENDFCRVVVRIRCCGILDNLEGEF